MALKPKPWWLFFTGPGVWVTLSPNIYQPRGAAYSERIVQHELVHLHRQRALGLGRWLFRYVTSRSFRLSEEAMAFKHELRFCVDAAHRDHVVEQAARQLAWFNYWFAARSEVQARRAIEAAVPPEMP